jgi:hypothetical protein
VQYEFPSGRSHNVERKDLVNTALPKCSARLPLPDFVDCYGVSLSEVSPKALAYFLAARSLMEVVEEIKLPTTQEKGVGDGVVQNDNNAGVTHILPEGSSHRKSNVPSERMDIGRAGVFDLPFVLPYQRCYPDDVLLYQLVNGNLSKRAMLHPSSSRTEELPDERSQSDREDFGSTAHSELRAYLVLDTSQSMNGAIPEGEYKPDVRNAVARGLGLAFLINALERGAEMHVRPFNSEVGNLSSKHSAEELAPLARELMGFENIGTTKLQEALEFTATDLDTWPKSRRIDVMLVTDGLSTLRDNPMGSHVLHTFLIGDTCVKAEDNSVGVHEKLESWSTTMHSIRNWQFDEIVCPKEADLEAFERLLVAYLERSQGIRDNQELSEVAHLICLAEALREMSDRHQRDVSGLSCERVRAASQSLFEAIEKVKQEVSNLNVRAEIAQRTQEFEGRFRAFNENSFSNGGNVAGADIQEEIDFSISRNNGSGRHELSVFVLLKVLYGRLKKTLQFLKP